MQVFDESVPLLNNGTVTMEKASLNTFTYCWRDFLFLSHPLDITHSKRHKNKRTSFKKKTNFPFRSLLFMESKCSIILVFIQNALNLAKMTSS